MSRRLAARYLATLPEQLSTGADLRFGTPDAETRAVLEGGLPGLFPLPISAYTIEPPSWAETFEELAQLVSLSGEDREANKNFIMVADRQPLILFTSLWEERGVDIDQREFIEILRQVEVIIAKLKWRFNRPRPRQVAAALQFPFQALHCCMESPAFPSGHTIQTFVVAEWSARADPAYREQYHDLAWRIGHSRILGGYHFPSDVDAGRRVGRALVRMLPGR